MNEYNDKVKIFFTKKLIKYCIPIIAAIYLLNMSLSTHAEISNIKTVNETGNLQGNIINGGDFEKKGNWIYGALKSHNLSRISDDGEKFEDLTSRDEVDDSINVIGNYVFYRRINGTGNGNIYKMQISNKKCIKLSDDIVRYFYINDGYIYYSKIIKGKPKKQDRYEIYRMNLDGKRKLVLYNEDIRKSFPFEQFVIQNNYLYFLSTDNNSKIYKYDIANKKLIDISTDFINKNIKQVCTFIVNGNNIFFNERIYPDGYCENANLYSMTTQGNKLKLIDKGDIGWLNVDDKWIYYTWAKSPMQVPSLYKIMKNGIGKSKIANTRISNICIIDNYIYGDKEANDMFYYKVGISSIGKYKTFMRK